MMFLASLASDEGEWRGLAEELAPSLRVSPVEVERRIRNAVDLARRMPRVLDAMRDGQVELYGRSEEHTSELQSRENLVCRLLLEKKKMIKNKNNKVKL